MEHEGCQCSAQLSLVREVLMAKAADGGDTCEQMCTAHLATTQLRVLRHMPEAYVQPYPRRVHRDVHQPGSAHSP